jgi:hypothetical protein
MFKQSLVAIALLTAALGASAGLLAGPVDVADQPTPSTFDFGSWTGSSFDLGALKTDRAGTVTYSFIGAEAAYSNQFMGAGSGLITNGGGASIVDQINGPGNLVFSFATTSPDWAVSSARNGGVFSLLSNPSFAIFRGAPGSGYQYVIGFNDVGYDSRPDFDDLVIGVNFTPVPEPTTYTLILAGLAAIGFVVRRRRG